MTSEGLGEMFEGDSADMCAGKFPLVSMGGRAEGLACADLGARTPIGTSRNSLIERSHAGPTCVPPNIPSAAQDCTTSIGTPAQTCVTDVQQSSGNTTVQLMSPEWWRALSHGQAHGSTSGGGRHHWHDTQQSSLSLIRIHHHQCSCTQ